MDNRAPAVVKRLAASLLNSGKNITIDNYFTSYLLVFQLLQVRTSTVGTLRKNKREILPIFVDKQVLKQREVPNTLFGSMKKGLLLSYTLKKN